MPMNRKLYPKDWDAIALAIKTAADWKCQECDRPCRRPGESEMELFDRLPPYWQFQLVEEGLKFGRHILTVAHLNHRPEDCRPENLKALCSVCHLRYDAPQKALKQRLKREREGQLKLPL